VIHTMPDKTVRVTSRFPDGHGTVYFDLERGQGFTLEQDQYRSEVSVLLRMVGCYSDCAVRYGDPAEAEADFADLTTMLGDRHHLRPPASPSTPSGAAKRKRWGWKGAVAGLAIGAIGAHFAPNWRTADTSAVHAAALGDGLLPPGFRGDGDLPPPSRPLIPPPALPLNPVASARPQPTSRAPAPAPNFGLQQ